MCRECPSFPRRWRDCLLSIHILRCGQHSLWTPAWDTTESHHAGLHQSRGLPERETKRCVLLPERAAPFFIFRSNVMTRSLKVLTLLQAFVETLMTWKLTTSDPGTVWSREHLWRLRSHGGPIQTVRLWRRRSHSTRAPWTWRRVGQAPTHRGGGLGQIKICPDTARCTYNTDYTA